jgi:hypothetical protein
VWGAVATAVLLGSAVLVPFVWSGSSGDEHPTPVPLSSVAWSSGVTRICAHALLFEGRHESGTRAGAVAVAADIRSSTERRIIPVARLSAPAAWRDLAQRWIALERRLAAAYAASYLGIYDVIAATHTPRQHAQEPRKLGRLLHAPDQLSMAAARLAQQLHVPDCTGGTPLAPPEARLAA